MELPKAAISSGIYELIISTDETITASTLAPILGMHPQVICKMARDGTWDRQVCNYVMSGKKPKFFRIDFLRKGGWIE